MPQPVSRLRGESLALERRVEAQNVRIETERAEYRLNYARHFAGRHLREVVTAVAAHLDYRLARLQERRPGCVALYLLIVKVELGWVVEEQLQYFLLGHLLLEGQFPYERFLFLLRKEALAALARRNVAEQVGRPVLRHLALNLHVVHRLPKAELLV